MIKILKYCDKKIWAMVLLVLCFVIVQVYSDLQLPELISNIINCGSEAEIYLSLGDPLNLVEGLKSEIINNALQMLGYVCASLVSLIVVCFLASKVASSLSYKLRDEVYSHIQSFSIAEIDKFSTSSLITRTTNDITQVQMVIVMILRIAFSAPITAVYGIIKAGEIQSNATLSSIIIFAVLALVTLVFILFILVMPRFKRIQTLTDRLNGVTRENLTGLRVIKAYSATSYQEEKFSKVNSDVTNNNIFVNRVMSLMNPGMMLIMNGTSLSILWIGSYLVNDNEVALGSIFGFQQITMQIVMAFLQLIMIFIMIPRGIVSARRINEVLDLKPSVVNKVKSEEDIKIQSIEFKNVSFRYLEGGEPVLSNLSFKVNKGEVLAIIGSTGSGKTSLVNLINRLYDPTEGEVLINGKNIKDLDISKVRDRIGFIKQKALLFKGTIKSNLLFGKKDATLEEIDEALKVAKAYDFVSGLDNGIESIVSQGGNNFSGGQKQRLSIARAVIKKPDVFVFDDSFSALDFKTDRELRIALSELDYNPMRIIVAQRVGTVIDADKILVLDDGKIVGFGNHKELMKTCNVYEQIVYSQITKEEAENE